MKAVKTKQIDKKSLEVLNEKALPLLITLGSLTKKQIEKILLDNKCIGIMPNGFPYGVPASAWMNKMNSTGLTEDFNYKTSIKGKTIGHQKRGIKLILDI